MNMELDRHDPDRGIIYIESYNEQDTLLLGENIGRMLDGGAVISLDGDLGAGKTVLVKGIAAGLGCSGRISSPTFTLLMEHQLHDGLVLCHFDAYRLNGSEDFTAAGLDEYIGRGDTISVIEWGSVVEDILPDDAIGITLESRNSQKPDTRHIKISWPGKSSILYELLKEAIKNADSGC